MKFLQGKKSRFHRKRTHFSAHIWTKVKSAETTAIQGHINNLGEQYYNDVMEYFEFVIHSC